MERLTKFDYENYRALKPKQDLVDKLGELEDVLKKYNIENLDDFIKEYSSRNIKLANDNYALEQELAELKQKAIVPKFKIGQEVWFVSDPYTARYAKVRHMKIEEITKYLYLTLLNKQI